MFGRAPDLHPMGEVYEWYFGDGGVQLVDDAKRAGNSMLTVIVSDLEARALDVDVPSAVVRPRLRW